MFSNRYIFIYSAVLVVVVAVILALAATLLKPFQDKNIRIEKMQYILTSANIENNTENAEDLYEKHVVEEIIINKEGEITHVYSKGEFLQGDKRAFDIDFKAELKKLKKGETADLPCFKIVKNTDTLMSFPMQGIGLWGAIWGYISLEKDFNTIAGSVFDHKGETPGLGAEISTAEFQKQFINKKIFDENENFVSVKLVKGGAKNSNILEEHAVDAISGGTITSNGTSNMIDSCLRIYIPFFQKNMNK
jgi:Na+-transporting NADH:ubiquinone oxidoreductase subunit C